MREWLLQMGGPEGVSKAEVYALVTGQEKGLWMLAHQRVPTNA